MSRETERRPGKGGVHDDDHGGGYVSASVTERWVGTTLYSVTPAAARDSRRGLAAALDHLDELSLCACWVAPRRHPRRAA